MIENIHVIVGLPGSGKTSMALELASHESYLIDDLSIVYKKHQGVWEHVLSVPEHSHTLIVTDVDACFEPVQKFLFEKLTEYFPQAQQKWTFFSNDKLACEKNILARNDGRKVDITLRHLAKSFKVSEFIIKHAQIEYLPVFQSQHTHHLKP